MANTPPTKLQNDALYGMLLLADFSSIVGCLTVLLGFWRLKLLRNHITRVIACFCVTSAIKDFVAVTLTLSKSYATNKFACYVYAVDITFGSFSCWMWTLCLALSIYLVLVRTHHEPERLEKFYMIASWGLPLISCIIMVSVDGLVMNVGSWCWIGQQYQGYRFGLFYIPMFIIYAGAVLLTGLTMYYTYTVIYKNEQSTKKAEHRKYQFKLVNYIVVFLVCWIFAVINRILNAYNLNIYATNLLHTYLSISHGFYASLVFIYNNPVMWRYFVSKVLYPFKLLGLFTETYHYYNKNKLNNNSGTGNVSTDKPHSGAMKTCVAPSFSAMERGESFFTDSVEMSMMNSSISPNGSGVADNIDVVPAPAASSSTAVTVSVTNSNDDNNLNNNSENNTNNNNDNNENIHHTFDSGGESD
ncbi:G-protein-coupled receptor [Cavenderia fasciculata]|uniref:G-protein-coupled receptor n=1 Tax=Cavenderia fasciculata TaxID=261658 RepID=F4PSJ3_CACFS|nr:G-protein-coupled receptor [Cavenderia fasciculata]EGG21523.1 G-protein-coupled receptor [Cavenderia fasciculata]|eukprot:XP_004359373.1 G-protein-coupled receptor [Cavenderia fasciculata]